MVLRLSGYQKTLFPPVKLFRIFGPNIDNPKEIRRYPSSRWFKGHFNESMDFNNPEEFDDPQVVDDPTLVSTESMDFDNPKVYGDTSIFDGLVFQVIDHLKQSANSKSLQKV